jgi:hypothetical protein
MVGNLPLLKLPHPDNRNTEAIDALTLRGTHAGGVKRFPREAHNLQTFGSTPISDTIPKIRGVSGYRPQLKEASIKTSIRWVGVLC